MIDYLLALAILLQALAVAAFAQVANLDQLRSGFQNPPLDCRVMMRWWWFGPAVTKPELERELRAMKDAGIGGVELQPVYPLALDEPDRGFRNSQYLSDEFLGDVRFAAETAQALGLRFDLTLASGWPFGGPHIPVTQAAGKLRVVSVVIAPGESSVPWPSIANGENFLAAFLREGAQPTSSAKMLELREPADGRLEVAPSANQRAVTFYIASRTGMTAKRPAVGAEGFVLDHFDEAAIRNHLDTVGNRLLEAFGPNPPYSVFSDSLEVYGSDWTRDLPEEFHKRRGYDLTPYLLALIEDIGPETADIRRDWGKTLTELIDEHYLIPIREWARQHGTRFRSQTYGIPAVSLSSNQYVDLPEGEGDRWRSFSPTRWASSASHLEKRTITSAETWTWLHSPAFRATPLDMKADAERFFLEGVNQIVGHGWPYSPPGTPEPGWSFYAAGAFNDHNPWWPVMPELTRYLERISYLLRQGDPAADVALLLPTDDAWAEFVPGKDSISEAMEQLLGANVIPQILDSGNNFDFIDADAIDKLGIPYPVLILPHVERLPLRTYRNIERYSENGGLVIATERLPAKAPGLKERDHDSAAVDGISQAVFHGPKAKGLFVSDDRQLGATLEHHFVPDITASPKVSALGFVHRKLPFSDIYFLVNTTNRPIATTLRFRTQAQYALWWDAFTAESSSVSARAGLKVDLEPYESRVFLLSNQRSNGGSQTEQQSTHQELATIDLGSDWRVRFPQLNHTVHMSNLRSWTDDPETRFYSGRVIYEKQFSITQEAKKAYLDFGSGREEEPQDKHLRFLAGLESPIREVCQVFVDDRLVGSIWKPPYRLELRDLVRKGDHRLRIEVYNTAINELAGRALPDYRLLNSRYGQRFIPQDTENLEPLPSGLLGTPRLVIEAANP